MSCFKKYIVFFLVLSFVIQLNAIPLKDYTSMADRDRIMLAISYYEVGERYIQNNKKNLGEAHIKYAIEIEPQVKRYRSGELTLPVKSISIDWESIFDDSKEDVSTDTVDADEPIDDATTDSVVADEPIDDATTDSVVADEPIDDATTDSVVADEPIDDATTDSVVDLFHYFMKNLNDRNVKDAVSVFSDTIFIRDLDINLTKEEFFETISGWLEGGTELPHYEIISLSDSIISVVFSNSNFFLPLKDNRVYLKAEKNDVNLLFTLISTEIF